VYNRDRPLVETTADVGFRTFTWLDLWLPPEP
jgi:hypothetical protein